MRIVGSAVRTWMGPRRGGSSQRTGRRAAPAVLAAIVFLPALLGAGCGEHEFEPPSEDERVEKAAAMYSPALFDTVTWASDSARLFTGNDVYAVHCRRCHGFLGTGESRYAEREQLEVPSLVEPGWEYAADMDSLLHSIFVGHGRGMPTWGVGHLSPRAIDAAAYYLLHGLRPDVLGGDAAPRERRGG